MGEEGKKGGKERGTDEEMGDSDERERETAQDVKYIQVVGKRWEMAKEEGRGGRDTSRGGKTERERF